MNQEDIQLLFNDLLRQDLTHLSKLAQTTDITRGNQILLGIAEKLLNALPTSDIYAERPDAELFIKDLTNLDSLLFFLQTKEFKFNGRMVVYSETPGPSLQRTMGEGVAYHSLPPEEQKLYVPYPDATNPKYFVYKDGLIAYLHDLSAKLINDPFGQKKINDLVQEIETKLKFTVPPPGPSEVDYTKTTDKTAPTEQKPTPAGQPNAVPASFKQNDQAVAVSYTHLSPQQQEEFSRVLGAFPLHPDRINYQEIINWTEQWSQLVAASIKDGPARLAVIAVRSIPPALQNLISHFNTSYIPLPEDAQGMVGLVHNLRGADSRNPTWEALQLIAALIGVMPLIRTMLVNVKDVMPDLPDNILKDLNRQVGEGNSIWQQNYGDLQDLYRQLGGR